MHKTLKAASLVCLLLIMAGSLALSCLSLARIAANPALAAFRSATSDEIIATTDTMLAREATPARLAEVITARLDASPRNWLAIDALVELAAERAIPLPPGLQSRLVQTHDDDYGLMARTTACLACAYDPALCSLSQVLLCQAPIALTPIGDLTGVIRAGMAFGAGQDVDQIDLALSVVGLGATAAVLVTGGASGVVKAGASLAKLARRMGRLSPRLLDMASDAVRTGVNWPGLTSVRSVDQLRAVIRPAAFAPLSRVLTDLDSLRASTDISTALHLLPLVDDAADADKLARAAKSLGPKLVGRAEVLGKARLFRATLRITQTLWFLASGFVGLALSLAGLLGGMVHHRALRRLRRAAR